MYEFDRATPVTVALHAHSGHVEITAEERATVQVEVQPFDDTDEAREAAARTRVVLEGDTLLIQAPGSDRWRWRRSPRLRIGARIPAGSALAGKSAAADIRATGVYSVIQLDVASAAVELEEITGDAQLEAASGDLAVARVGGALRIKSSSGRLRVGDVTGDVSAETASGDITVGSGGGSLRAETASGDIRIGSLREGQARLRTASGDVEVGVAVGTGVWLDLDTASGKSVTDLAVQDGGPTGAVLQVRVRTASGDILVRRAAADLHPA
ncbi:DUF4097 family beta strand repeat-containing protein [Micromonosporaceae bacterium Da 78-11]